MILLGTIKHVQIQRESLKAGERPNRYYTPEPLLVVDQIEVTQKGVFGIQDEQHIIDVHHIDHPGSRNRGNNNSISINFTGHYKRMREQYGSHLEDGIAGENILVENDGHLLIDNLGERIAVENAATGGLIYFEAIIVAEPCAEFSCFTRQRTISGEEMKETLQFLGDGMRGFYMTLSPDHVKPVIQAGDKVYSL